MTIHTQRTRTVTVLLATVAALLIASGCNQSLPDSGVGGERDDPDVLIFASLPSDRYAALQGSHQPILEMLERVTGKEIDFETGTDYSAIIEGLRAGRIHIAAIGPLAYVQARQQGAQITAVAVRVDKKGEKPGYKSYGITRSDSPIKTLADFRGKRICFVDPGSASGYLYPSAALLAIGIDPERDMVPSFKGRHDAVVMAVDNQQCDAGFALDRLVDRQLIEEGRLQPDRITTVWSEEVPGPPIVIANHLNPELRRQLTTALRQNARAEYLRANGFCQGECAIADGVAYGYEPIDDAYYDKVREICRMIQNNSCTEN